MMRYLTILALILLAVTRSEALDLSLEECLRLAEQNDRNLKASQAHRQSLGEDVNIARKSFFPTFKLTAGYTLIDRPTRMIIDGNAFGPGLPSEDVALYDARRFRSASLIVAQPLFLGGALTQNLNRSRHLEEKARLEILRQQAVLQRDTEDMFFRTLNAQLHRQASEKILEVHKERLRLTEALQLEGYAKEEDILAQKTALAFAESEVYRSHSRERIALGYLKNFLYLGTEVTISLKTPSTYRKLAPETPDITPSALVNRNDYLALQQQVEAADSDVKRAQSRRYPQISMFGQYTRQDENNLDRDQVWTAGARLEWSIFEWGKNLAEIRRAQAEKLRLQHQREAYAQGIRNETGDLWGAVREKEIFIDAWELKTRLNKTKLERIMEEFREGKVTLSDVLAQEAELVSGYNNYRKEINELEITLAHLRAALAVSLDEWLIDQEIYQPNLEQVNTLLQQLPGQKEVPLSAQRIDDSTSPPPASNYAIQLGSFPSRQEAEKVKDRFAVDLPERTIEIIENNGSYTVFIPGLRKQEEAQALLSSFQSRFGINGYLFRMTP